VLHELGGLDLLAERVGLDLVDGRDHLVMEDQVHQAVGREVAHADSSHPTLSIQLLHRTPRTVVVAEGLVDEYRSR